MEKAFKMIREVKSSVISTIEDGKPTSRIIDIMHYDEKGIYFTTCKTKPFYRQLMKEGYVSLTVMNEDYVQVRVSGYVKVLEDQMLEEIFDRNPALRELFPGTHTNFVPFKLYKGKGEIFDLSGKEVKMQRERFAFGGEEVNEAGCKIDPDKCIGCGKCQKACPFGAINQEASLFTISSRYCDECGICHGVCPVDAIDLPRGM